MENPATTAQGVESRHQPIDQLETLLADVESFFNDWLQRVEQLQSVSTPPDAMLQTRIRDFELAKSQWEAKRVRETRDIHEKAEALTKSWLRLEEEQRRFLQIRDSRTHTNRPASIDSQPREPAVDAETSASPQPTQVRPPVAASPEEPNSRRPSPLQGQRPGASAVHQFEQLRREIQSNRHQHRRV